MADDAHVWPVALRLADGTELTNIPSIDVKHDMLSPGSAWSATLWWSKTSGSEWREVRKRCKNEEFVYVEIGGATQLLGRIEEVEVNAGGHDGGIELTISGRDVLGRLIDWDADPRTQLRNTTLEEAIAALCDPFGVRVFACDAAAERDARGLPRRGRRTRTGRPQRRQPIDTTRIQPGQRVWEVIDKLCRAQGFLVWGAPTEYSNTIEVVIDKPASASPPLFHFERVRQQDGSYRGNMLRGAHRVTTRNVPSQVTAFGHAPLTSSSDARLRSVYDKRIASPYVADVGVYGHKPRYLQPDQARTERALQKSAERVYASAMADFRTYEVKTRGFGQERGGVRRLFTMNSGAHLRDDVEEPELKEDMLIRSVHFHQSREQGQVSTLLLVQDGAIAVTGDDP